MAGTFTSTYRQAVTMRAMTKRQLALRIVAALIVVFGLSQLVPYGRAHSNPPATQPVKWDSPATAKLFSGACADCHSNLTTWKWYSNVAPASWLVQRDVDEGRNNFNVSEWNKPQPDLAQLVDAIRGGGMPPIQYKILHPKSRLSSAQRDALIRGLEATYRGDPPKIRRRGGD